MDRDKLLELVSTIESQARFLVERNVEKISADIDVQHRKIKTPEKPQLARLELLRALKEMDSLVEGPMTMVMRLTGFGVRDLDMIRYPANTML